MVNHELPQSASNESDYGQAARAAALENSGFNETMVHAAITGSYPDSADHTARPAQSPSKPRASRRGGRSFPQASDQEIDPFWNVTPDPKSPDEIEAIVEDRMTPGTGRNFALRNGRRIGATERMKRYGKLSVREQVAHQIAHRDPSADSSNV